jgi:hypothetical protein
MAGLRFLRLFDLPERRLFAVASPVPSGLFPDGIPARLVVPVIVASADCEITLSPDDLGAELKTAGDQAVADGAGKQAGMPDVGDVAREERPGFAPVRLRVVQDFPDCAAANLAAVRADGLIAPVRVVIRPRRAGQSPSGVARPHSAPSPRHRLWLSLRTPAGAFQGSIRRQDRLPAFAASREPRSGR